MNITDATGGPTGVERKVLAEIAGTAGFTEADAVKLLLIMNLPSKTSEEICKTSPNSGKTSPE